MKKEDGTENCAAPVKFSETSLQNNYSILFLIPCRHITQEMLIIFFSKFFSSAVVIEWNKLDQNTRNSENLNIFKKKLLQFIRPSANSVFRCHNLKGVKLLTILRLFLSHLREHKFKHDFLDSLNPICSCDKDIEMSTHFLLHCSNYSNERLTFLYIIRNNDGNIKKYDLKVTETLLYGDSSLDDTNNPPILNAAMEFLIVSKRFDVLLV